MINCLFLLIRTSPSIYDQLSLSPYKDIVFYIYDQLSLSPYKDIVVYIW